MSDDAGLTVAARAAVPPFHVMDVWDAAQRRQRSHGDVVNLAAGQPAAPAPVPVRQAAAAALETDRLGYTEALGIHDLRVAIATHYATRYGLTVDPDDIIVTTGSSGGFLLAFLAAFDAGDRVALASPGYPCYRNILTALGCEVVELPAGAATRFQPTVSMLEELDEPVKGLVVASPANPTGTVLSPTELGELSRWCERHGVQLISDEVYHGLTYGAEVACAWDTSTEAVVVNSFSKYFAMTGWRLGWLLIPRRLRRPVDRLAGNFTICPPALPQYAAVAAFEPESYAEADGHVAAYRANRDLLLDGLPKIGIERMAPADGAFYIYADVSDYTSDSLTWCRALLEDTGVAIAPGVDFDATAGDRFVRMSFAGAAADLTEALRRMGPWLRSR